MKVTPYIELKGECNEAISLYENAFKTKAEQVMRYGDIPDDPNQVIPSERKNYILQAKLKMGDSYIRLADSFEDSNKNETKPSSVSVETDIELVKHAFETLSKKGRVLIELEETFFSPLYGELIDKYGVYWHLATTT